MKTFIKNNIIGFMLGALIFGSIGVVASGLFASNITYDNTTSGLKDANDQDVTTVQGAIDVLKDKVNDISNEPESWSTWLKYENLDYNNYKKSTLLSNQNIMRRMMNNKSAIDYLASSSKFLLSEILSNNISKTELLNSAYIVTVPTMTSNTSPNGNVFACNEYSNKYAAWIAFDGDDTTDFAYRGIGECYIGYKFTKPVSVFKFELKQRINGEALNDATLSYSDDGINYTSISQKYSLERNNNIQSFEIEPVGRHLYWRIENTSGYHTNGGLSYLQFYGI